MVQTTKKRIRTGEGPAPNVKDEAAFLTNGVPLGWVEVRLKRESVADVRRLSLHVDPSACWYVRDLGVLLPMVARDTMADGGRWVRALLEESGIGAHRVASIAAVVPAWGAYHQGLITRLEYERAVHGRETS